MGLIWRLFAPKSAKSARRSVHKVTHPVRTATPKPIKNVRHAAYRTSHPLDAAEHSLENQAVRSLRGSGRSPTVASNGANSIQVRSWAKRNGYAVADKGRLPADVINAYNRAH